ncbi:MAG: hypothetical protein QOF00_4154 [Pseudonocardiales bacterium]|nr:hypothetical protein [Pseudonocardiales bacterium]
MSEVLDALRVAGALRMSISLLTRKLRQSHPDGGLTSPEMSALARLDRGGPATSAALAKLEQISPQSMGATLGALDDRGLVERRPDPQDGRRVLLSVTDAGRTAMSDRRDARTRQLADALSDEFTPVELERLLAAAPLLERLAARL